MADGSERLPWLDERRSPPASAGRAAAPWGWAAGALAVLGVAAGAYLFGTRTTERSPAPAPQIVERAPSIPPALPVEQPPVDVVPEPPLAELEDLPTPPPLQRSRDAVREIRESAARARAAEASTQEELALAEGSEEQAQASGGEFTRPRSAATDSPPPVVGPVPVIIRTPAQSWGRKVQLGAYRSPAMADTVWRGLVKRYPYLAGKPKLVTGIDVRSTDGKATRMYRLQLAAASQAQAVVICQQLQRAGQSCVVVY
ncbi:SPOR domain-containing protein [Sphingomonas sp. GCM10030256]|uniref:SPOR domain-containing protein n=1 Tax=Sphingomonas sp. GCM10030256 TaxID=3273427 RepID=UPI00360A3C7D